MTNFRILERSIGLKIMLILKLDVIGVTSPLVTIGYLPYDSSCHLLTDPLPPPLGWRHLWTTPKHLCVKSLFNQCRSEQHVQSYLWGFSDTIWQTCTILLWILVEPDTPYNLHPIGFSNTDTFRTVYFCQTKMRFLPNRQHYESIFW